MCQTETVPASADFSHKHINNIVIGPHIPLLSLLQWAYT